MKKFLNDAAATRKDVLDGFARTHRDIVELRGDGLYLVRRHQNRDKVALISGGGSGHEPMHIGFVGEGMLDAACPGEIFTSPTPNQIAAAAAAVGGRPGVLFVVKNYAGDVMNFSMARDLYDGPAATVVVSDDVATMNDAAGQGSRGIAGTVIVERLLGAAAERGTPLERLSELGSRVADTTRSFGVALNSATIPVLGRPTFALPADEIEIGVGIHSEVGCCRAKLASAREIAREMIALIAGSLARRDLIGAPAILLVNGFGATPPSELYLMANMAGAAMERHGLIPARSLVGNYATSLDMAGCSFSLCVVDDELLDLWDAPVHTAALRWGRV